MALNRAFGLPLLAKELIEQSARRRTYIIRSVYAILFFGFALMIFWGSIFSDINSPYELLGKGREMFSTLLVLQIFGVALFTPALTCGIISSEKERNTIGLLFLTKLGPSTILLEKYLGRLFLMGTYLLISLPLFGFCYSLGGIEQKQVWFGFYGLIVTVIQLAALGLFCSTYFRTTVGAFIATYLIGLAMFFGPAFMFEMLPRNVGQQLAMPIWMLVEGFVQYAGYIGEIGLVGIGQVIGMDVTSYIAWQPEWSEIGYGRGMENGFVFFAPPLIIAATENSATTIESWQLLALGMPALGTAVFFLLLSRLFIVRRAFVSPKRYLLRFFQVMDGLFHRANQNPLTRGVILIKEQAHLPKYDPIAWRETTKTTLGSFRYLVRIFVAIEFPVVTICALAIVSTSGGGYQTNRSVAVVAVNFICWIIAILLTVVRSATLVAGERAHETLDVLLTTPISSHQLVTQKFRGVKRLMIVVAIPLLTGMFMQAWYGAAVNGWVYDGFRDDPERDPILYLFMSVLCVCIYLPLFAWVSMLLGMWMKTSTRAIFASLALVVGWMVLPIVFLVTFIEIFDFDHSGLISLGFIASPAMVPFFLEVGAIDEIFDDYVWSAIFLNVIFYAGLLFAVRGFCLKYSAKFLGRSEDDWI